VSADAFVDHLADRMVVAQGTPVEALGLLHVADLYLALGCALADAAALAAFDERLLPAACEGLSAGAALEPGELRQLVRVHLLAPGPSSRPRIAAYAGTGPLKHWLRAAAHRAAIDELRRRKAPAAAELDDLHAGELGGDPELDYLKRHYRGDFREAFGRAFETLSTREKAVLRLHVIEGLTTERIGAIYGVTRVTVSRWLSASKAQLLDETRRALAARLSLPPAEVESLLGLLASRLDVSLLSLLRE
jgi:RNA polymerase sigma-70 factor (ECF subfamily)